MPDHRPNLRAMLCAHAAYDGDAQHCSCTALGPGPHIREQILTYEAAHAR